MPERKILKTKLLLKGVKAGLVIGAATTPALGNVQIRKSAAGCRNSKCAGILSSSIRSIKVTRHKTQYPKYRLDNRRIPGQNNNS